MKTLRRIGLVVILVGLMVVWGLPGLATADGGGADVINEFDCVITLGPIGGLFIITNDSHSVVTPSGNTLLKCTADIPTGLEPTKAVRVSGFLCNTYLGLTTNTMKVFTPGGKVHLTCQINGSGG